MTARRIAAVTKRDMTGQMRKGIDDEETCDNLSTDSESFKEGCKAYVNGGDREDDAVEFDSPDSPDMSSGLGHQLPATDQDDDDKDDSDE